ncbi:MAG TPA: histidine phosphatase family protein, partial [Gammaproteobacteria bacterium]|nr:histidine phosphatase family protein [Gammaproteobacteria bacterium]
MMLYLLRHAKAIPRQGNIQEEHRFLSPEGRERFNTAAIRMRDQGLQPDLILTSPLARSVQTAEILA